MLIEELFPGGRGDDAGVVVETVQGGADEAVAVVVEREADLAHVGSGLAAVVVEGGGVVGESGGEVFPESAGFDGLVLVGVADGADRGADCVGVAVEAVELTVPDRGGLVDDDDGVGVDDGSAGRRRLRCG